MSSTSNGSVTPRASAKPRISVLVKDLFEASQRLSVYQKELGNVDRLLDEKKQLEEEVKSLTTTLTMKDQEIARLSRAKDAEVAKVRAEKGAEVAMVEAEKDIIHKEYEKRFLAWHTGTTKQEELEAKVVELELQLSDANKLAESSRREAAGLKDELTKSKKLVQTKDSDLKSMNANLEKMDLELTGARSKLESLQRDQKALGLTELSPKTL
jgi:chromosome segregation ATPase